MIILHAILTCKVCFGNVFLWRSEWLHHCTVRISLSAQKLRWNFGQTDFKEHLDNPSCDFNLWGVIWKCFLMRPRNSIRHRHSIVHFGGQFTLMTSNKQIERQTATIMFKWQHMFTKQLIFHRYAHIWSVTLVWYSKSAKKWLKSW